MANQQDAMKPAAADGAAASQVAVSDDGRVMVLRGSEWQAVPIAENAEGQRMFLAGDGAWKPVPGAGPAAAPAKARTLPQQALAVPGRTARAALQATGAAASLPYNAAALVLNTPAHLRNLAAAGASALGARRDYSQPVPFEYGAPARWGRAAADRLGLPEADNEIGRIADRGAEELIGAGLTMGAGLGAEVVRQVPRLGQMAGEVLRSAMRRAPTDTTGTVLRSLSDHSGAQAAGAVGAGALGGLAHEEAPDNPWLDLGASMVGGLGGAAAAMVPGAVRGAGAFGQGAMAASSPQGRDRIVGRFLAGQATDPNAAIERLANPRELVPGSAPTSAEAAGDRGLLGVERGIRNTTNASAFNDVARTEARREAVDGVAPPQVLGEPRADAGTVADRVLEEVARTRERAANQEKIARTGLAGVDASLPPGITPESSGAAIRGEAREAAEGSNLRRGAAFSAVDPDNTSQIPLAPVRAAAGEALARLYGTRLGNKPPLDLLAIQRALLEYGDGAEHATAPWRELSALYTRAMQLAEEASAHGDSQAAMAYGEVAMAVKRAGDMAAAPYVPQGRPIGLEDLDRQDAQEGAGAHPDVAQQLQRVPTVSAGMESQARRDEKSLIQFLVERGGLAAASELRPIMGTASARPGLINGARGQTMDQAIQAAIDAGYFPEHVTRRGAEGGGLRSALQVGGRDGETLTPAMLLDAIDAEMRGLESRYPGGNGRLRERLGQDHAARADLEAEIDRRGGALHPTEQQTLASLRPDPAEVAPEVGPRPDALIEAPAEPFTPEQAARYNEAQEVARTHGRTFQDGPMGDILRNQMGQPVVPNSGVAQRFFRAGSGSPEAAAQFLSAVGDRPAAVQALESHAATSLRDFARRPDGLLDPAKVNLWLGRHQGALRAFPELAERFQGLARAAETVERVVGNGQASVREIEQGVARYFLDTDPKRAVAQVIGSSGQARGMQGLRDLVARDARAVRGLQQAYIDVLMDRIQGVGLSANAAGEAVDDLSGAKLVRFLRDTRAAGQVLFSRDQMATLDAVAEDWRRGSMWQRSNAAAGSPTAQNLSMAYLLGSIGAHPMATAASEGLPRSLRWVLGLPHRIYGGEMERLLVQAAVDPATMRRVLQAANEDGGRAFTAWAASHGSPAITRAIAAAGIRAGANTERRAAAADARAEQPRPDGFEGGGLVGRLAQRGIRAFHGSPHQFDRFSMDKIGTGEGAQAYGHGLYFAGNEDVARVYRDTLSGNGTDTARHLNQMINQSRVAMDWRPGEFDAHLGRLRENAPRDVQRALDDPEVSQLFRRLVQEQPPYAFGESTAAQHLPLYRELDDRLQQLPAAGHMYEVNLDVDPERMLDWDRPLREQHPAVREAVEDTGLARSMRVQPVGRGFQVLSPGGWQPAGAPGTYRSMGAAQRAADGLNNARTGANAVPLHQGQAQQLYEAGVPGVRYLDGMSRDMGAGSHNFVTFSDEPVEIIRRYADGGEVADYDYSGARAAGVGPDARGHWPDTHKLPNHITFSDGSVHSTEVAPGGHWQRLGGDRWSYEPSATVLQQHSPEELRAYFQRAEPGNQLLFQPGVDGGGRYAQGGEVAGLGLPAQDREAISGFLEDTGPDWQVNQRALRTPGGALGLNAMDPDWEEDRQKMGVPTWGGPLGSPVERSRGLGRRPVLAGGQPLPPSQEGHDWVQRNHGRAMDVIDALFVPHDAADVATMAAFGPGGLGVKAAARLGGSAAVNGLRTLGGLGVWDQAAGLVNDVGEAVGHNPQLPRTITSKEAQAGRFDRAINLFHGSPHVFDRFLLRHMGRGEGAQAFGKGHYLTESEPLAERYRRNLTIRDNDRWDGDGEAPYRLVWGPEGEQLLSGMSPHVRFRARHAWPDQESAAMMLDPEEVLGELNRSTYHRPEWLERARDNVADGNHDWHIDQLGEELKGELHRAREVGDPGFAAGLFHTDASGRHSFADMDRQIADLERLRQLPLDRVDPALGATYQVRLNADPSQFLSLDNPMDAWSQPAQVLRGLESVNWGPKAEEALFSRWNQLTDPRTRMRGLEEAHLADQADIGGSWVSPSGAAFVPSTDAEHRMMGLIGKQPDLGNARFMAVNAQRSAARSKSAEEARLWRDVVQGIDQMRAGGFSPAQPTPLHETLNRQGIVGSRFLDGNSRRSGAGSHNFVVFGDDPIEVTRRYADGGAVGGLGDASGYEGGGLVRRLAQAAVRAADDGRRGGRAAPPPYGPILGDFQDDYHGAARALQQAQSGVAQGALFHPEVGYIDLPWGFEGTGRSDGHGLSKMLAWHPEVVRDLPDRLLGMRVDRERSAGTRLHLRGDTDEAGVSLDWAGEPRRWIVTAFDHQAPRRTEKSMTALDDLLAGGASLHPQRGADELPVPPRASNAEERARGGRVGGHAGLGAPPLRHLVAGLS